MLAVVLYHTGAVSGGFVGVDVFFVVSGFLITGLLWRELNDTGRISLVSFYARRARRLLPAAALVLVATVVASAAWLAPLDARAVTKDAAAAGVYAANYRFAAMRTDYLTSDAAPSPLQHYWSLGVEEQFYVVWPVLLLLAAVGWRRSRRPSLRIVAAVLALVGMVSLGLCLHLTAASQPWAFFSLPTRAWELVAGGLVALTVPQLRRLPGRAAVPLGWLGVAVVVFSVLRLDGSTPFPGLAALAPVGGTAAVLAAGCATPRRGANVLLSRAPLQGVGRISYSWYLWHWPVLVLAPAVAGRSLRLVENLALAAFSAALAVVTVRLVEDPVRFSPALAARPRWSLGGAAALTAASVLSAVVAGQLLPDLRGRGAAATLASAEPVPDEAERGPDAEPPRSAASPVIEAVEAGVSIRAVPSNLDPPLARAAASQARPFLDGCSNRFTEAAVHRCVYGDVAGATSIVLFGDSHAAQWFPALDTLAKERGWRLISLTKATCPPVVLSIRSPVLGRPYRECDQWRDRVLERIGAEKPALVVLGAARHYDAQYRFAMFGTEWLSGMGEMVRRIQATGARVVVLGPTPRAKENVPKCLSAHLDDATACTQALELAVNAEGSKAEQDVVVAAGGRYVRVAPWVCTSSTCAVIVGNLLVYRDDNHLTTSYVSWLKPALTAELDDSGNGAPRQP